MRFTWFVVALVSLVASLSASNARAEVHLAGHTWFDYDNGTFDGTDNWVVVDKADLDPYAGQFQPGTGSPGWNDAEANIAYAYQLVNNGDGTDLIDTLRQISFYGVQWGWFSGVGLTDAGNPIGQFENMGTDTWPSDGWGLDESGDPGFTPGQYRDPVSCIASGGTMGPEFEWSFDAPLAQGDASPLLVLTTRFEVIPLEPYEMLEEAFHRPDCTWFWGANPARGPEPGTATMCIVGAVTLLLFRKRK